MKDFFELLNADNLRELPDTFTTHNDMGIKDKPFLSNGKFLLIQDKSTNRLGVRYKGKGIVIGDDVIFIDNGTISLLIEGDTIETDGIIKAKKFIETS